MQKLLVLRDFLQNGSIIARKLYARIDPAQRFLRQPAGGRDRARRAWITPRRPVSRRGEQGDIPEAGAEAPERFVIDT